MGDEQGKTEYNNTKYMIDDTPEDPVNYTLHNILRRLKELEVR